MSASARHAQVLARVATVLAVEKVLVRLQKTRICCPFPAPGACMCSLGPLGSTYLVICTVVACLTDHRSLTWSTLTQALELMRCSGLSSVTVP